MPGEAAISELLHWLGDLAAFRVLSRDPAAVRAIADEALPEHQKAVETWLDAHGGRHAA